MGILKLKDEGMIIIESVEPVKIAGETRFKGKVKFPNSPKMKSVTIFDIQGELIAIPTYCPHEQADLSVGLLIDDFVLQCPLHQNQYDLRSGVIKVFSVETDEDNNLYISREETVFENEKVNNVEKNFSNTVDLENRNTEETIHTLKKEVTNLQKSIDIKEQQISESYKEMQLIIEDSENRKKIIEKKNIQLTSVLEFMNRVTNSISEILIVIDNQGIITDLNNKIAYLEYSKNEVIGKKVDLLFSKSDLKTLTKEFKKTIRPDQSIISTLFSEDQNTDYECHLLSKAGNEHVHLIRGSVIYNNQGKSEGVVIIGTDIQGLKEESSHRQQLIHVLCHDLKNPLSSSLAAIELSKSRPEQLGNYLSAISNQLENGIRILDLIKTILAIQDGKINIKLAPINVDQIIKRSLETLNNKVITKELKLICKIDEQLAVMADETALENSVINNLLTNAIKFSPPKSTIEINVYKFKKKGIISIRDQGIGMPQDLVNKIFSSTEFTTRVGTDGEKGTGFGMPLVKKFVEAFGGTISVISSEKVEGSQRHGTVIEISLHLQTK